MQPALIKRIISASRRTDLVASFPRWLARAVGEGQAVVRGPSGKIYATGLRPETVHTLVLWSKDFSNLLENRFDLMTRLARYDQLYFLFSITGLGGTFIERGVPPASLALEQLPALVRLAGHPRRVSVRFDPVVFWREEGEERTNLDFFEELAPRTAALGIRDIRFSIAQWYGKAVRRSRAARFDFRDPPLEEKKAAAGRLARVASAWGLNLFACSQDILAEVPGVRPSACIDGALLRMLHPSGEPASLAKDKGQRAECRCTESVDIGSYSQACPHCCLYCYANPRLKVVKN
jgi:hypothetical protein